MIALRDIRPADKETVRDWRNLPDVAKYMYTDHHITTEEHDRWFAGALNDPTRRYWVITFQGADVGLVNLYGIDTHHKRCYWAYYIASPNVRGKGIGSFVEYSIMRYVFDEMHFNKLCCEVLASNQAVVDIHKSFGSSQEGYFRQHVFKAGKYEDVVSMGILRGEWESKRAETEQRLRKRGII